MFLIRYPALRLHKKQNALNRFKAFKSDPDWIRTNDPQLRRLMLYPAELPGQSGAKIKILPTFCFVVISLCFEGHLKS